MLNQFKAKTNDKSEKDELIIRLKMYLGKMEELRLEDGKIKDEIHANELLLMQENQAHPECGTRKHKNPPADYKPGIDPEWSYYEYIPDTETMIKLKNQEKILSLKVGNLGQKKYDLKENIDLLLRSLDILSRFHPAQFSLDNNANKEESLTTLKPKSGSDRTQD
jgi:hypothetical protein